MREVPEPSGHATLVGERLGRIADASGGRAAVLGKEKAEREAQRLAEWLKGTDGNPSGEDVNFHAMT